MNNYIVDIILNPFDYRIDDLENAMDIIECHYDSQDELAQLLYKILYRLKRRVENGS